MIKKTGVLFVFIWVQIFATLLFASEPYPQYPNPQLTPGEVCQTPNERRYPERIAYCRRNVDKETKVQIIKNYDEQLGYNIQKMPRNKFKIDHYIPLCMGGSNNSDNLWPQHETIYVQTDTLEFEACEKMSHGRLQQARAIELIKRAKNYLHEVPSILQHIRSL